jgi:NTP pyrophosphatase (non-canonical NTP hydrolase)
MAGEVGECCNLTKKMLRLEPTMFMQMNKEGEQTIEELKKKLALELGDVVIYADLLASRLGLQLEDCIRGAFNNKSDELGVPEFKL